MARAESFGIGLGVDTRELGAFTRALRRAAPATFAEVHGELAAAGEIVAQEAREIASQHSQTIPGTIKTRVRGTTVSVYAGGPDAPLAALYELGNKGRRGRRSAMFRHPVFGNRDVWVEQARYPFLHPAAEKRMPEVEALMLKAADDVIKVIKYGR